MEAGGRDNVILCLLPLGKMGVRAVLAALPSLIMERERTEIYKRYVSESLMALTSNTSRYLVAGVGEIIAGSTMQKTWWDIVHPKKKDSKTPEQIVEDTIKKAGLKVVVK